MRSYEVCVLGITVVHAAGGPFSVVCLSIEPTLWWRTPFPNISRPHPLCANLVCFATFWFFFYNFCSDVQTCQHVCVGGGVCILFEICEKRPFQKCMSWVGGRG